MKFLRQFCLIVTTISALAVPPVHAATNVGNYELPVYSDVFITAVGVSSQLEYVELYNVGASLADVRGWKLKQTTSSGVICTVALDRYLIAKDYGLIATEATAPVGEQIIALPDCIGEMPIEITLSDSANAPADTLELPAGVAGDWRRKGTTTTYRDGAFEQEFVKHTQTDEAPPISIYTGGWYVPDEYDARLKIVEVVANPRGCSPTETALDCADYVKLYVGNMKPDELAESEHAVRTDSGGRNRTSSNGANVADYPISDDGHVTVPLSITNSGGYVWIEDMYGARRYEASVVAYPDAGAESKRGYAWALGADGVWQWTSTPRPDAPNNIYLPPEPLKVAKASTTLTPCREGQERNPATNRCRSIVDAIAALVPCREGQQRNPDTNRCRAVLAASNGLAPCKEGQERNPETNRCRKITLTSDDIPAVTDVPSDTQASRTGWIVAGIVVAGAIAYALYEWRDDIRRKLLRRK